jgi:hypothetical protein
MFTQVFLLAMGREQEKLHHIGFVNLTVIAICIAFAVLYPSIGTIIRFRFYGFASFVRKTFGRPG